MAFEGHAEQAKEAVIQSPVEALPNAQGHAREAVKLLKTFQNCVATADKIRLKK